METMVDNTVNLVKKLSEDKLQEAYNYLLYLSDKEDWEATYELNNPEIMEEISQGLREVKEGNYIKFNDIRKYV